MMMDPAEALLRSRCKEKKQLNELSRKKNACDQKHWLENFKKNA